MTGRPDGDGSGRHVEVVATAGHALAEAVGRDRGALVARYPTWTVAELGRHVGAIHRWVADLVADAATTRRPQPDVSGVADADVPGWLEEGTGLLVDVLRRVPPGRSVWTFAGRDPTVAFWRRRMAVETTLHRWDAQDAVAQVDPVPRWLAVDAVDEALEIYLGRRPEGADVAPDDRGGDRLLLTCEDGARWTVRLAAGGVVTDDAPGGPSHVELRCTPLRAWLLLTGRRGLAGVEVVGDRTVATRFVRAVAMVPGPDG